MNRIFRVRRPCQLHQALKVGHSSSVFGEMTSGWRLNVLRVARTSLFSSGDGVDSPPPLPRNATLTDFPLFHSPCAAPQTRPLHSLTVLCQFPFIPDELPRRVLAV